MASASITIAVNGRWNGSAIDSAERSLRGLSTTAAASADKVSRYLERQQTQAERLSRMAASTSRSTASSLAQVGNSLVVTGGEVYDLGKKMESVGDTLTRSVTLPMVALGGYAAKAAVEYDTALANVRKTTDMTEAELERLGESALELSRTQPVTAETILNVEALGAQLGVADDRLEDFAVTVTGLDIATNMDAETAGTEMARFANIVGMADDQFQNYGSTIVAIGNNMATTESEVSTMAQRFASAGHQAGLSEAEILGLSGAMSSLGLRAEMGGSSLSQVFTLISKSVSEGGDSLEAFASRAGKSAEEFAAAWRDDAAGAFVDLLTGIHDATEAGEDMNVILSGLGITQIRNSDTMRRLAGSVDVVTEALDLSTTAWEENTALQDEVDSRNQSMASRLQVLKNNIDAVATTVGVPLVNALIEALQAAQPLIDAAGDAAQAFADADEGTQRLVLSIAGIAAGSGPALSALGKIAQGVGTVTTAMGHGLQDVAVYRDAMTTLDGAQMRTYSSAETLATKLGLSRNAVANAAGGVDRYVDAWERNYDAQRRVGSLTDQITGLLRSQETATGRAREAVDKKIVSLVAEREAAQGVVDSTGRLIDGWKQAAGVADDATDAAKGTTGALSTLRGGAALAAGSMGQLVASFAPMVAVTAVVAGVSTVVADLAARAEEAREHEELLEDATRSVSEIMGDARGSASGLGDAIGSIEPDVEPVLESLRELNESVGDTFEEYYVSSSKLDQYVASIEELANQTGLTASQQWELEAAVEGYNEVCGTQYEVVDGVNGKIADQDGVIQENTDKINENAEAWRQRAQAEALQGLATEYMEAEAEAAWNLELAQERLAEARERQQELQAKGNNMSGEEIVELNELNRNMGSYEQAVTDASAALDTASESARTFSDWAQVQAAGLDAATTEMARSVSATLNEMGPTVSGALSDMGIDVVDLSVKMAEAGVTSADLSRISSEEFATMAESCGGSSEQLAATVAARAQETNDSIHGIMQTVAGMRDGVAQDMEASGISVGDFAEAMVHAGYTADDLRAISSEDFRQMLDSCGGDIGALITLISEYNRTDVGDKSASVTVDTSAMDLAQAKWERASFKWKTTGVSVNFSSGSSSVRGQVYTAGRLASGGIVRHADGFIANRPVTGVPVHVVGEAGAEAVVPLTNRHYAMPFVRMIAEEVGRQRFPIYEGAAAAPAARVVTNHVTLRIDGRERRMGARGERLLEEFVAEIERGSGMGVTLDG